MENIKVKVNTENKAEVFDLLVALGGKQLTRKSDYLALNIDCLFLHDSTIWTSLLDDLESDCRLVTISELRDMVFVKNNPKILKFFELSKKYKVDFFELRYGVQFRGEESIVSYYQSTGTIVTEYLGSPKSKKTIKRPIVQKNAGFDALEFELQSKFSGKEIASKEPKGYSITCDFGAIPDFTPMKLEIKPERKKLHQGEINYRAANAYNKIKGDNAAQLTEDDVQLVLELIGLIKSHGEYHES